MLGITVIAVGKIKESFFRQAIEEYKKRLGRYCSLEILEVKDEPTPDKPSDREKELILEKEGERIIGKIPKGAEVVTLCVEGKQETSEQFAQFFEDTAKVGKSRIVFIIGGSFGLSQRVKSLSAKRLGFSKLTFPHQLIRVVLLEQIYRGFTINEGKTYHK